MAVCPVNKIDSNATGIAIAREACPGILPGEAGQPGDAVWEAGEPNSYADFGGEYTTVARNPINESRQNQKGVMTDLEATGGFTQDFTLANSIKRLEEFFFAEQRSKPATNQLNLPVLPITAAAVATGYAIAGGAARGFAPGQIVLVENFNVAANNGLKVVTAASATATQTAPAPAAEAVPPTSARMTVVGFQFPADAASIAAPVGDLPRLVVEDQDFAELGLIPGEWIFVGGDMAVNRFDANTGFARIKAIAGDTLIFDKVDWAPVADDGAGKTLRIFFGDVIKNEKDPLLIKSLSVQIRRTLGNDTNGVQSEYLIGCFANEMTLNMPLADKMTVDFGYVAMDHVTRNGTQGLKPGVTIPVERRRGWSDAYNTSSDFTRIKLALVNQTNGNPEPLFAFANEMSLSIANGVTMNKALGRLGAFDKSLGNFVVTGSLGAYLASLEATEAVRNNADVTLDMIMSKNNTGMLWDIPLLTLGGGRVTVEQDQPVMLPLESSAAESEFGHTLLFQSFKYLPDIASA